MNPARLASILFLLTLAGYCGFSLMRTFRPPGFPALRAAYAVGTMACLAGASLKVVQGRAASAKLARREESNER